MTTEAVEVGDIGGGNQVLIRSKRGNLQKGGI
jgi:hypothetical protein